MAWFEVTVSAQCVVFVQAENGTEAAQLAKEEEFVVRRQTTLVKECTTASAIKNCHRDADFILND